MWLKCQASLGQFSSEAAVVIRDHTGLQTSLFAERTTLAGHGELTSTPQDAFLRVVPYSQAGHGCVRLPARLLATNRYLVVVRPEDLLEHLPGATHVAQGH